MYKQLVRTAALLAISVCAWSKDWTTEVVDDSGPASSTSMKADKVGNLHLAYVIQDGNTYPLKYAFWDKAINKWFVMQVATGAGSCSLTLDKDQRPHISYVDFGTGSGARLRYAYWTGSSWRKEPITLNSDVIAYYSSIALDLNGQPTISFYEYRGPRDTEIRIRLRNVTRAADFWQVRTVDGEEGSGKFNCTAADSRGNLHIAYANVSASTAGMRYAYWNGKTWKLELIDGLARNQGESVGYSACIALDAQDDPHVAYINQTRATLLYAVRKMNRWVIEPIEALSGFAYPDRNSIVIDAEGRPYLGYYDAARGELRLAHKEAKKWIVESVDAGGSGFTSSIQVDRGVIHISYGGAQGIKVARRPIASAAAAIQESAANKK